MTNSTAEETASGPRTFLQSGALRRRLVRHARRLGAELAAVCASHRLYLLIVFLFGIVSFAVPRLLGVGEVFRVALYQRNAVVVLVLFLIAFAFGHMAYWMLVRRPKRLARAYFTDLRDNYLTAERLLPAAIVILTIPLWFSFFTVMKVMIPVIHPFSLDPFFADLDRWLHFGVHPWQLLQPILGYPTVTWIINILYNLWLFVVLGVLFWQTFSVSDKRLRMRFLLSFLLCWILIGNGMATLLSSAGPVYYERVVGAAGPYAELMTYLHSVNEIHRLWALDVQEMLWADYLGAVIDAGSGISAMPSLHVSMTFLFVLVAWRVRPVFGWLACAYLAVIMIGSVHLAWHYAVDGYLAIPLTWAIWRLSAHLVPPSSISYGRKENRIDAGTGG